MNQTESTEILIGTKAHLSDGVSGEVMKIVIDVSGRAVTDLVICVIHPHRRVRLVPLNLVSWAGRNIELPITHAEFEQLAEAEETRPLTGWDDPQDSEPRTSPSWAQLLVDGGAGFGLIGNYVPRYMTYDKVPLGDVMVAGDECVHASDGDTGRVEGVLVDNRSRRVTHVLIREGHFLGHKHVAIPMNEITQLHDGLQLDISKHQIEQLPSIDINDPAGSMGATS